MIADLFATLRNASACSRWCPSPHLPGILTERGAWPGVVVQGPSAGFTNFSELHPVDKQPDLHSTDFGKQLLSHELHVEKWTKLVATALHLVL